MAHVSLICACCLLNGTEVQDLANLDPFRVTTTNDFNVGYYQYFGITTANQNSCRCTTVLYALLSACVYCQVQVSRAYYPSWVLFQTTSLVV